MKKRACMTLLLVTMFLLMVLSVNIFAMEFSDVKDGFWAKDTIAQMSDKNIVVGYTDGTFRPNNEVKKVEVLILLSRILGVNAQENAELVSQAEQNFGTVLDKYDTYAKKEISYLLQNKILKQDEIDKYIGNGNDEKSMLRIEGVPLITRIMDKESELAAKEIVLLTYKDVDSIPQELRPFVEYLGQEGLMVSATDDNEFLPNGAMTRAQIATLASRLIKKLQPEEVEDSLVKYSGAIIKVEKDSIVISSTVNGEAKELKLKVNSETTITANGQKATMAAVKVGDYAMIDVNGREEAISIVTEIKNKTIVGVINSVDFDNKIIEVNTNNIITKYNVSNVEIIKNEGASEIGSIRKGDMVMLYLDYNVLKKIQLKSTQKSIKGIINEIIISKTPKITIMSLDNKLETYELNKFVKVNILDSSSDIYGLRLNYLVTLILDSNEVEEITSYEYIKGQIDSVVEGFGQIVLLQSDGNTIQLLTNSSTQYANAITKGETSIKDIKQEQKVIAIGTLGKTAFYAKEIHIIE